MENSDSGSEIEGLTINKNYAKRYNTWRQKEEFQKLKDKYGEDGLNESSSSESEDEDAEELTPQLESDWLKTLTALKSKDPKIYDKKVQFYNKEGDLGQKVKKSKPEKPFLLKDYERNLILEKDGIVSESDEDEEQKELPKTYFEEQEEIKENLKLAVGENESDSDSEFLTKRKKTAKEKDKEERDYKLWVETQKPNESNDKLVGIDPWKNTDMNSEDTFLRDYIMKKGYLEDDNENLPSYDDIVDFSEDEEALEKQDTFERKFNFRYEEPDQEFIKSFPRTIGESVRRKDDRRIQKRKAAKDKKDRIKQKKMEELKQLKNLKKIDIMEKMNKIKKITGESEIKISHEELEEDFDPDKYDKMMKNTFDNTYYDEEFDDNKPELDAEDAEELGVDDEMWDTFVPTEENYDNHNVKYSNYDNDMTDEKNYNVGDEEELNIIPSGKKKKKKSKFAKAVFKKKPVFDPNDRSFEQYIDEYYKLDYEDMIGDLPCRFRYRSVIANDFGLTVDEVLKCPERELNQWVSVKKMSQYRTEEEELYDKKAFKKKVSKKTNILLSLKESAVEMPNQYSHKSLKKSKKIASIEETKKPLFEESTEKTNRRRKKKKVPTATLR